jgi:hypothetical protein
MQYCIALFEPKILEPYSNQLLHKQLHGNHKEFKEHFKLFYEPYISVSLKIII